ncbi:MAG TPA: SIS domain-containing protein [Bacteroidales bacterium]|nr:SIS domain-containing protein [Bacteroidales bacterium]
MEKKTQIDSFIKAYQIKLNKLIDLIEVNEINNAISTIIKTFKNGNTLYICGNGGSAATASHMQADISFFIRYFTKYRPKVRSLTDNVPIITAVGNDTSFNDIFVEQLKGNFIAGDSIICISASGNSENVIKAAEYANNNGGHSIAFVGFEGGKLKDVASIAIFTPNPKGDYGPIEDVHMIISHILVNYLVTDEEFLSLK